MSDNGLNPHQEKALADVLAERIAGDVTPETLGKAAAGDTEAIRDLARRVAGFVSEEAHRWA